MQTATARAVIAQYWLQGFSGFRVLPETKGASPALAPLFPVCSDFLQPPGDILVQHTGDEGLVGHALP